MWTDVPAPLGNQIPDEGLSFDNNVKENQIVPFIQRNNQGLTKDMSPLTNQQLRLHCNKSLSALVNTTKKRLFLKRPVCFR